MPTKRQFYRPQVTRKRLHWARLKHEYKKFKWFYFRIVEEENEIEEMIAEEEMEKQLAIDEKLNKEDKGGGSNYFH